MDDDSDMAEMYLTEKKLRSEAYTSSDVCSQANYSGGNRVASKSAPVSPVGSAKGSQKLQRAFSSIVSSSKYGSLMSSSSSGENIDQLEMLLEAYFVFTDNNLSKLLSVRDLIFYFHPNIYLNLFKFVGVIGKKPAFCQYGIGLGMPLFFNHYSIPCFEGYLAHLYYLVSCLFRLFMFIFSKYHILERARREDGHG